MSVVGPLRVLAFLFAILSNPCDVSIFAQVISGTTPSMNMPDWQTVAGNTLAFEVATVKSSTSDEEPAVNFTLGPGDVYGKTGGRFVTRGITLVDYIRFAYKLTDGQVEIMQANAPKWITTERFDVQAKSELPDPTKDQMRLMMQSLLADRFNLAVHRDTRELPVLGLVLVKPGKLGPQLRPHPIGDKTCSNVPADAGEKSGTRLAGRIPMVCGDLVGEGVPNSPSHIRLGGGNVSLGLLAAHLGEMGHYDRPILDQTGLTGTFDLVIEWGPASVPDSTSSPVQEDEQSMLQEALKDQLGLTLKRTKALSTILLVDHLDRQPASN